MRGDIPPFPHASAALAPLRAAAEADGRGDYSPMWAGQAASIITPSGARELTERLGREALALLGGRG
jgi:nitronate monooxygenase